MEYLILAFTGLLAVTYIVCSIAELLLSIFDRISSHLSSPQNPVERKPRSAPEIERQTSGLAAGPGDEVAPAKPARPAPSRKTQSRGILIAAEHRLYRRILERWFRDRGFVVWVATNGREAVELHQLHSKDIALALLDLRMPILDGPATLAALRREAPSIRCCIMTPKLGEDQEAQLLALGAAGVFEKPLLLGETTAIICELISNGKTHPE
jgi:CheY-like chemotaxis protein